MGAKSRNFLFATLATEHGIPDFISFMRARNPVFWPKRGSKNRGFRALLRANHANHGLFIFKPGGRNSSAFWIPSISEMYPISRTTNSDYSCSEILGIGGMVLWLVSKAPLGCDHLVQTVKRFPIYNFGLVTAFRDRMTVFESGDFGVWPSRRQLTPLLERIWISPIDSVQNLCSPNEDLGSPNEPFVTHFRSDFKVT